MVNDEMDFFLSRTSYFSNNIARNRKEALSGALRQHFSKFIPLKSGSDGDYIPGDYI